MKKILSIAVLLSALPLHAAEPASEMATAATSLLSSLDQSQTKKIRLPFDSEERENWHYVPKHREGLAIEGMDAKQISLLRALLKTALSESGLEKVDTIIALENLLWEASDRADFRNPKAYFTTIFGQPSATGTWAWRYEGHHLALNYTIIEGETVTVTPSFFGANPAEVTSNSPLKGTRALAAEEDLARALARTNKKIIFSEKPPREILTRADRKAKQLDPVGIKASEMTPAQQNALTELVSVFANRHRKQIAEADLARITLPDLHFGWAGSLETGKPFYYRIQGRDFLIEVANIQNGGNHIHTVWRDRSNDFGRDLLGDHADQHH